MRRLRAVIQFDEDEESERVYQKVRSGTLKGVSVGYVVDVWEEVKAGATSTNGRFTGPCEVATRWTPYELSIVSVPPMRPWELDVVIQRMERQRWTNRTRTME